jgi:hypothetical protein
VLFSIGIKILPGLRKYIIGSGFESIKHVIEAKASYEFLSPKPVKPEKLLYDGFPA